MLLTFDAIGGSLAEIELAASEFIRNRGLVSPSVTNRDVLVNPFLAADTALVATAANMFRCLREMGFTVNLSQTATDLTIDRLHASGLSHLVNSPSTSPTKWLVPVQNFVLTDPNFVGGIATNIADLLPSFPDKIDRLYQCLSELTENVRVHSGCSWGGYLCANVPVTTSESVIRISVADFGHGIHSTLSPVFPYNTNLAHDVVLYEAFKYWVTGKPGQRAGSGLPYACEFVKEIGGVVRAYSGTGCIRVDRKDTCLLTSQVPYPGTVVTIDLPMS